MDEYDIAGAFAAIENELIASMIRNMERHRAEETEEGIEWTQWQVEQLKALEKYKLENQKKYTKQFKNINAKIDDLIRAAHNTGNMEQEIEILEAIKKGFKGYRRSSSAMSAKFFRLNERKLNALVKATMDDMKKAETAVLRMSNDQYRKAVFNAQVYANTGAGTYEKAVDMATKDLRAAGLNCVEYANGARHTLSDYADMVIRTSSKRAYLQGEGEKRQEWGITTVIMNKRGNPCPKCLPWVGKVLIDDVWSGGSADDGPYPLMSTAIAAGLYHPRCKDGHTTYFEGISTPPDDQFTRKEIRDIEEENRKEAEQKYADRQAEKFDRMARYSLDEENRKNYQVKADSWKECSEKLQNSYMPAKTIEEAQQFAERFCQSDFMDRNFKGKVDFKGISLEHANEINRTLEEIYRDYDIPKITGIKSISPDSTKGRKIFSSTDSVMAYSPTEHGIYINRNVLKNKDALSAYNRQSADAWNTVMENVDALSGNEKELAARYRNAGRSLVGNGSVKDYFTHELGHHVQWEVFDAQTNNTIGGRMSKYSGKISGYAGASKSEYFAESFSAYMRGERDILDPDYVAFMEKKYIVKPKDSGIIKLSDAEQRALNQYLSFESYGINEKLRKGLELNEMEKEMLNGLDSALKKFPKYEGDLSRSLYFGNGQSVKEFVKIFESNDIVPFREFISTTSSRKLYNPDGEVQIFIYNSKQGRNLSGLNVKEAEVLYERNSEFRVVKIVNNDGKYHIILEEA